MNTKTTASLVHILAIVAGVLGIISAAAPTLGLPAYAVGALGVAITVLIYVANQLPNLGEKAAPQPAETSPAPVAAPAPALPAAPESAPGPAPAV